MLLPLLACLQGILAGCWIVGSGWVRACLEAGGTLLPEEPFEVQGDGSSGSNGGGCSGGSGGRAGPAKGRQHRAEGKAPLLSGWQVFVCGSGAVRESCAGLVRSAGGSIVARLPPAPLASQQQQQQEGERAADGTVGGPAATRLLVLLPEPAGAAAGSSGGSSSKGQMAHAEALGVPVLGQKWLTDSVSCMQLLPMDGFRV